MDLIQSDAGVAERGRPRTGEGTGMAPGRHPEGAGALGGAGAGVQGAGALEVQRLHKTKRVQRLYRVGGSPKAEPT